MSQNFQLKHRYIGMNAFALPLFHNLMMFKIIKAKHILNIWANIQILQIVLKYKQRHHRYLKQLSMLLYSNVVEHFFFLESNISMVSNPLYLYRL